MNTHLQRRRPGGQGTQRGVVLIVALVVLTVIGDLVALRFQTQSGAVLAIERNSGGFTAKQAAAAEVVRTMLRSGEIRRIHVECRATIGEVGNEEHSLRKIGKAGAKRWLGIRPTVRGAAMNPVDHPHGGGEGRAGQGNPHPVSPWGVPSKGYKTRKNKRTQKFVVRDRRG